MLRIKNVYLLLLLPGAQDEDDPIDLRVPGTSWDASTLPGNISTLEIQIWGCRYWNITVGNIITKK